MYAGIIAMSLLELGLFATADLPDAHPYAGGGARKAVLVREVTAGPV